MKKLVSIALAAILSISSFAALAAPEGGGPAGKPGAAARPPHILGTLTIPSEVSVDLDAQIANGTGYGDYASADSPLVITTLSNSASMNAKATIDMTDVAEAWGKYINAGVKYISDNMMLEPQAAFEMILEYADLSASRFTATITADSKITNTAGAKALSWCEDALALFEQDGEAVYTEGDKTTFSVTMKPKAGVTNADFNAYFEKVNNKEKQFLTLTLENNLVTDTNVIYKIESKFDGKIVIGLPGIVSQTDLKSSYDIIFKDNKDENYVKLTFAGGGGGGGIRPTAKPTEAPTGAPEEPTPVPTIVPDGEPTEEATPVPTVVPEIPINTTPQLQGSASGAKLEYIDHFAYIIGYDENETGVVEVKPENHITRAEVATIFYRLLDENSKATFRTDENGFADVEKGDWYNIAISTIANAGIVEGYDDGGFKPDNKITRAELATIIAKFTSLVYEGGPLFTDVHNHWAKDYINNAAITGWINGYDDRSFKPNNPITRAETITMINRVLYRLLAPHGKLDEGYTEFVDNNPDAWYHDAFVEAANSHHYDREEIGHDEAHTDHKADRDWEAEEDSLDNFNVSVEE